MTPTINQAQAFFETLNPVQLLAAYGSPLYVYREDIIRQRAADMQGLCDYPRFDVHYSAKANSNVAVLQIIRDSGLQVDAMSAGEIYAELFAGFQPEEILFVSNNVDIASFTYARDCGILTVVDSLSQLERYGQTAPGTSVVVRFNPGVGDGHHAKTITAGDHTKFGVAITDENLVTLKGLLAQYDLRLAGLHMHIGSLFLEMDALLASGENLLAVAKHFPDLDFVDLGGGFGISYHKSKGDQGLDLAKTRHQLTQFVHHFNDSYKVHHHRTRDLGFKIEPGRYLVAEAGVLLGTVMSTKQNYGTTYVGTNIGFNAFMRPTLYDAAHDLFVYDPAGQLKQAASDGLTPVTITGNVCENSDNLAVNRPMPPLEIGDTLAIMDAGAYGHVMSSNYNNMLRPAEVMIRANGTVTLVRARDALASLLESQGRLGDLVLKEREKP